MIKICYNDIDDLGYRREEPKIDGIIEIIDLRAKDDFMKNRKTAGILFCIFFYIIPVCIAAEGGNENSGQEDWLTVLRAQGVSENRILGVDENGIPRICGTTASAAPIEFAPETATENALPSETRGWEVIPNVIRDDGSDSFRLEVDVNGLVNGVTLDNLFPFYIGPSPTPILLQDDGQGEDRVAGDNIFTCGPFVYNTSWSMPDHYQNRADSPEGLYIGTIGTVTVAETDETTSQFLITPAAGILDSDIPVASTIILAPDIVVSSHLINIQTDFHATQRFLHVPGTFYIPTLAQQIYQVLPDRYDFFMFFSTSKIERLPRMISSNFIAGIHSTVQTKYSGIGLGSFDTSANYGSSGRLLGLNALDTYDRGIWGSNATHELVHQWAAFLGSQVGLNEDGAHYNPRSNVGSLVGGFLWDPNEDGSFFINCDEGRSRAHHAPPLDLYLMGLIEPNQVPIHYVYSDASDPPIWKCNDNEPVTPDEIVHSVTIDDIITIHGIRTPGPAAAQRDFTIAFVAESHERLLTPTEITFYEILAEHYTKILPPEEPDPHMDYGWQSVTRFFGHDTTWDSQLSPELCFYQLTGDLNDDCRVDLEDYTTISREWLQESGKLLADIAPRGGDGIVNLLDLQVFIQRWLIHCFENPVDPACEPK
jgi:hypothetical protein